MDVTKLPWKVWDDAVERFGMDDLGASDGEPRRTFRNILKSAVEGKPYPVKRDHFEANDFLAWEFYSADTLDDGADDKDAAKDAWVAKVAAFDDYMRSYHAALSAACEVSRMVSMELKY